jgi:isoleucyl-tRNA synthetase
MENKYNVNVAKSHLSVGYTGNDTDFLSLWDKSNTFAKTNAQFTKKPFVLLDGPPYANGDAHMGHALNKLFKDLVVKSRWFMGQPVNYRPGWDCHGLPLELAVEKKYGKLDTQTLKTRCKQLAFRSLSNQRKSFKRLGVLGQWDTPYVTLSDDMVKASWASLKVLVEKNLLEYKQYPVHYCPVCASSLAEAELEHKVMQKDSLYFKMKLNNSLYTNAYALVWTTTPWTLPMNQGLVFHNDHTYQVWGNDNEYLVLEASENPEVVNYLQSNNYQLVAEKLGKELLLDTAVSPLTKKTVPVLHGDFVESGHTGFVHMACAHGAEDFELGKQHNVLPHTYLNQYGVFEVSDVEHLNFLNGKKQHQVQPLVCDYLNQEKTLVSYSNENVEQQVCWRHKCGVFYNATWQAFLKLEDPTHHLKNLVKQHLEDSSLTPHYKERLAQMLLSRGHWCLSRQRKWGTPMNLLVDRVTKEVHPDTVQYLEFLANGKNVEAQQLLDSHPTLMVFDDVLDVWFDSGNVVNHFAMHNEYNHKQGYVVDLALEGKDQFRGWFQSMLWLSVAVNNTMPYKNLFCHGFVLDEKRQKFSKSTGNGSLVDTYAQQHGADVLHLWVAAQEPELDPVFSDKKLDEMKKFYSRLRLALRFTTSNLYDYDYSKHEENLKQCVDLPEWDVHRLHNL